MAPIDARSAVIPGANNGITECAFRIRASEECLPDEVRQRFQQRTTSADRPTPQTAAGRVVR